MAEAKLQIIIDASGGNARAELGALQKDLKATGAVATEASDQQTSANKRTGLSMADLAGGLAIAKQGYALLEQGLQATVGKTVEYGEEVRKLQRDMGASSEEASMLIQAGDDVGVSYDSLRLAAKKLNKEGIEPNIENLGKMADEYLALPTDVAKAQFAADKFGQRAGPEMQQLLEKGSAGLQGLAQDAKDAGLVMSGPAVEGAHELWKAQDDLNDAMSAAALTIGVELVPMMIDLAGFAKKDLVPALKWAADTFVQGWEAGHKLWQIGELLFIQWQRATGAIDWQTAALEAQKVVHDGLTDAQAAAVEQQKLWAGVTDRAADSADRAGGAVSAMIEPMGSAGSKADYLADRTRAVADATDAMLKAHSTWLAGEAGDVISALQEAGVKADALFLAESAIDRLYGTSFANQDLHKQKIHDIIAEYAKTGDIDAFYMHLDSLNKGPASAAAAGQEQLYLDLVNTSKVLDPMPEILQPAAEQFGALGRNSHDAADALAGYDKMPDILRPAVTAFGELATQGLAAAAGINAIPKDTHVSVTTTFYERHQKDDVYIPPGPHGALGLDMIVPPGYEGDNFPIYGKSGERVTITPAGSWEMPPMPPSAVERRGDGGMTSQAAQGADGQSHTVVNNYETIHINDKLAVALYNEQRRQRQAAYHDSLM